MFDCVYIEKVSKKSGTTYGCIEITFPNGYKKIVFLDKAEEYLAKECSK